MIEDDYEHSQTNLHRHEINTSIPLKSMFSRILKDVSKVLKLSTPNRQQIRSDVPCMYHIITNPFLDYYIWMIVVNI